MTTVQHFNSVFLHYFFLFDDQAKYNVHLQPHAVFVGFKVIRTLFWVFKKTKNNNNNCVNTSDLLFLSSFSFKFVFLGLWYDLITQKH